MSPSLPLPTNEQIAELAPFERLGLDAISVVVDAAGADLALAELARHAVVGFDTEARPTFRVGEQSEGPHVVQFASAERAWIFPLQHEACRRAVASLLAAPEPAKVGFGLEGDRSQIERKFGVLPQGVFDLNTLFSHLGYGRSLGARRAVALLFQRRFVKSKRMTTSNWSTLPLSGGQIIYAANDAWAALRVYLALDRDSRQLVPEPPPRTPEAERPAPTRRSGAARVRRGRGRRRPPRGT